MKKIVSLFAVILAAPVIAFAQGAPKFSELKPAQPVSVEGNKIEVIEFFWYGCPHCYNLEPVLETWLKKLPPDVQFRRVPAVFNPRWEHDAEIFYAFDALGVLDKVHKPFFDAIHRDHLRTNDKEALNEWLQKNGHPKWKAVDLNYPLRGWEQYDCVRKALGKPPASSTAAARSGSGVNPVFEAIKGMLDE